MAAQAVSEAFRPISADSHVAEPPGCYIDHIERKYKDTAPKVIADQDGGDSFAIDGLPGTVPIGIISAAGIPAEDLKVGGKRFAEAPEGAWNPKARLTAQDRDGVAAEVIYPSVGMVLCNHPDPDYKQACFWAYNRWLAEEFVGGAPDRLIGLGQSAVRSVEEAIADLVKFKEMGFRGAMLPGNPSTEEDYIDPKFDPLWRASIELQMPISFHVLTSKADGANSIRSQTTRATGHDRSRWQRPLQIIRVNQDLITMFILGRVFERHPDLKIVCVEADAGWAPHLMHRLDHGYRRFRYMNGNGDLARMPSEYFKENVYMTFQDDFVAYRMTGMVNPRRLLWANDYPHSDSTWPHSQEILAEQTADMSEAEKRMILRDNVAELYRLH